MPDLDLRVVRYFVAVAEHRHFGRAATELRVAQPSLSRQIQRLEQQLGTRLLDRTPQGSALTEAGAVFLHHARDLLRDAGAATAAARAAAHPCRVTIGYTGGLIVTPAVRDLRLSRPDADVRTEHLPWDEPRPALLDGRVDVVVTRLPLRADGLAVSVLRTEPRAVVVPLDHRLAGRDAVTVDDIAGEPLPRLADEAWDAFWRIDPRPDGRPAPGGPLLRAVEDKFEFVAAGEAIAIVPMAAGARLRPDLVVIPLVGVEPARVVVASRAGDRGELVTAFRESARTHLSGP